MEVRRACEGDRWAIEALNREARRGFPPLWPWEEHLGDSPFVVTESDGVAAGALLAWPDESPVAWVRVAVLDDGFDVGAWLDLVLPPVIEALRPLGARTLAWMDYGGWSGPHLERRGFEWLTDVVAFAKYGQIISDVGDLKGESTGMHLRPASAADVPAVVAVDRAAFTPHWWQSEATMRRRAVAASYFVVAEAAGEVGGYAEGVVHPHLAHLNRIAVHPAWQGRGVGALLLRDALRAFWRLGAEWVTLNTQADNDSSQRMYRSFGFEPTGEAVAVWELRL